MNKFESWISRIKDKAKAISIHRDAFALYTERLADEPQEHSLLDDTIINDESVIWHFILAPDFVDAYIQAVKADGLDDEIAIVSRWYRLARALGPIRRRVLRKAW